MRRLEDLNIDIFADGADLATIAKLAKDPLIKGFTTNPSLMRKAGVANYKFWAHEILWAIEGKPVSFEVLADDFDEMERQARIVSSWGKNVYVKIPVMNTKGEYSFPLIHRLSESMNLNVTAVMTMDQIRELAHIFTVNSKAFVSIFLGRVADTGQSPESICSDALDMLCPCSGVKIVWASPREMLNIYQAEAIGCHAITVSADILAKRHLIGKDLTQYSLETVQQFHRDAVEAGYTL